VIRMKYIRASEEHTEQIFNLVQNTIITIYPKYYPQDIVDFFCKHHSRENIIKDIKKGCVSILLKDNDIIGTGSYVDNHITRVYVSPDFQGQGYGRFIMQNLENEIALRYDKVNLDASLPAASVYEHMGYKTVKHKKNIVENNVVLVYEVMEKILPCVETSICYEGRVFIPQINTENGEVDDRTIFIYHQKRNILWADYDGGNIIKGHLVGNVAKNGELDFYYQHINKQNEVKIGKCHSVPKFLSDGRLELSECWQWLNGDKSKGESIIIERK